jgi:hypothetical protein
MAELSKAKGITEEEASKFPSLKKAAIKAVQESDTLKNKNHFSIRPKRG